MRGTVAEGGTAIVMVTATVGAKGGKISECIFNIVPST